MSFISFSHQKFIEEKGILVQIDTSFQKCEEIYKDLGKVVLITFQWHDF